MEPCALCPALPCLALAVWDGDGLQAPHHMASKACPAPPCLALTGWDGDGLHALALSPIHGHCEGLVARLPGCEVRRWVHAQRFLEAGLGVRQLRSQAGMKTVSPRAAAGHAHPLEAEDTQRAAVAVTGGASSCVFAPWFSEFGVRHLWR